MNERTLIDMLALTNSWWSNSRNFPLEKTYPIKRTDFYVIKDKYLNEDEGLLICGSRGVGKSTVIYELMKKILGRFYLKGNQY